MASMTLRALSEVVIGQMDCENMGSAATILGAYTIHSNTSRKRVTVNDGWERGLMRQALQKAKRGAFIMMTTDDRDKT